MDMDNQGMTFEGKQPSAKYRIEKCSFINLVQLLLVNGFNYQQINASKDNPRSPSGVGKRMRVSQTA